MAVLFSLFRVVGRWFGPQPVDVWGLGSSPLGFVGFRA